MSYTLKVWVHPKTGGERIYINGPDLRAKVYLEERSDHPEFISFDIRSRSNGIDEFPTRPMNGVQPDEYVVERAFEDNGLNFVSASWKEILEAADAK